MLERRRRTICSEDHLFGGPSVRRTICSEDHLFGGPSVRRTICSEDHLIMSDPITRREFAERLALAAAAPYVAMDVPARPASSSTPSVPPQQTEPSALARALAESIRLRYGDRLSA